MPSSIPAIENLSSATKYVIAFAIIFILLALFALVLRRLTGGRTALSNERGRGRQPRLGIVDVYDLDRQRQLILLRRDNVEHLLLVGGPNDVVVETNIVRVSGARLPAAASDPVDRPESERVEAAPVRPAIDSVPPRGADRTVAAHLGNLETAVANAALEQVVSPRRAVEPQLKPTEIVARSLPEPDRLRTSPAPEIRANPRPVTTPVARANAPAVPSADARQSSAPRDGANASVLSNMARQLEDVLKNQAASPPREPPRLDAQPQRRVAEPARAEVPRVEPTRPEPARIPASPPPPPNTAQPRGDERSGESRPAPRAQESRVQETRTEEVRPPAPPQPARAAEPPRVPEPPRAAPPRAPDPKPPAPISAPPAPPPPPAAPEPAPVPVPPPGPAPSPEPTAPKPDAQAGRDPFSIEDIEAEFARLLGRPLDKK